MSHAGSSLARCRLRRGRADQHCTDDRLDTIDSRQYSCHKVCHCSSPWDTHKVKLEQRCWWRLRSSDLSDTDATCSPQCLVCMSNPRDTVRNLPQALWRAQLYQSSRTGTWFERPRSSSCREDNCSTRLFLQTSSAGTGNRPDKSSIHLRRTHCRCRTGRS